VVVAETDIPAGMELGPALTHDDVARDHCSHVMLDAKVLRIRIAAVAAGSRRPFYEPWYPQTVTSVIRTAVYFWRWPVFRR